MKTRSWIPISASLLVVTQFAVFLTSCGTVAVTGRSQLLLVSQAEEMKLGLAEFDKLKQATPISQDANLNALVQRVGRRIAAVASPDLPNAQWEFVLFDQPHTANAFCLPGGKVGIYTGILPITKNEAGLATVIAHEVAHAVARHGAERISEGLVIQLGGRALDAAMKTDSERTRAIALAAYGLGSTVGIELPHSRKHELEADHIGLIYMARAGYDPREAIEFWKRFSAHSRQKGELKLEFLSTHPVDQTRIAQLESLLPKAMEEYRKATVR